jgi:diguanylate cyclase (GGDEF)-like protein
VASKEHRPGTVLGLLHIDSIRNRILVLALLATLIPAFSTAVLSFERTRRALTETLESELQRVGSQSARELDLWVKERTYDLRVFVGSYEVTENLARVPAGGMAGADALARLTNYLEGVQARFDDYAELLVTDADGRRVASSSAGEGDPELPAEWLSALRSGETMLGEPYLDEALGAVAARIAVPIESADARFVGILVATLTFDALRDILVGFEPGEGGRVDLMTPGGEVIASSKPGGAFEAAVSEATLSALAGTDGTMEYRDNAGSEMVGALTMVNRMGWTVLAHLPTEEAYARITQLRQSTVLLVSFLLIIVGTVAYFIGLLIVRPLDRLSVGAAAVAGGDLSVDLPVEGRDEVALLTEVFNSMVADLRQSRAELDEAHAALKEQNAELEQISMTDALTSLYNRRYVMGEFEKEINRAKRHGRKLAVLMMDVDRFKQYNDTHGHQAGDEVLRGMGVVIRDATREPDIPARYGGEEFIVLLPDCGIDGAVDAAERVRARLAEEVFEGRTVTASLGAAEYPTHGETPKELIAAADAALYEAKAEGRDRVVAAGRAKKSSSKGAKKKS